MRRTRSLRRAGAAAVLAGAAIGVLASGATAQTSGLPAGGGAAQPAPGGGRTYSPEQLGAVSSVQRYMITSSANDRGAFLWIIDSIDRKVELCEKPATANDFTCTKKSLP